MILISGELIDKYNLSNIAVKKFTPAEKDPNNINTFIVSAEKWFLIKIPEEEYTSQKLNELIEEYLKMEEKTNEYINKNKSKRKFRRNRKT